MLTPAQNETLTRVGPGTPMGELFRRYWLPALMSSELTENDAPPIRLRLLCEDLVAFRDSSGHVGLVSAYCPHRRAPLFFGRNEEGGLRCVYHGWKFDRSGSCVDMPSEPPDSLFKSKVKVEAYPTWEGGGVVWTYMGPPGTEPPLPNYEFVRVPETHRVVSKTYEEANYLAALEGGLDSTHAGILHTGNGSNVSFLKNYERVIPQVEVRKTGYGYMLSSSRLKDDRRWIRVSHYFMPALHLRGTIQQVSGQAVLQPTMDGHIWMPIDDRNTWVWNFAYSCFPAEPLRPESMLAIEESHGRGEADIGPDFRPIRNRSNDYLIDRERQRNGSFTGIEGINTQDFALQESMEPFVDRTREHLGSIDQPIIVARQMLLDAIGDVAKGVAPPGADPQTYQSVRAADTVIPHGPDWQEALKGELLALY